MTEMGSLEVYNHKDRKWVLYVPDIKKWEQYFVDVSTELVFPAAIQKEIELVHFGDVCHSWRWFWYFPSREVCLFMNKICLNYIMDFNVFLLKR
jgi:hypothetical protein